jgi:hypothetical protein
MVIQSSQIGAKADFSIINEEQLDLTPPFRRSFDWFVNERKTARVN